MRIFTEAAKIAHTHETLLHIRYLRGYNGNEFGRALDIFLSKDTDVHLKQYKDKTQLRKEINNQ